MWLSLILLGAGLALLEVGLVAIYWPAALVTAGALMVGYALIRESAE